MTEQTEIIESTPEVTETAEAPVVEAPVETTEPVTETESPATEPSAKSADDIWDSIDLTAKFTDSSSEVQDADDAEGTTPAFPSEELTADADIAEPDEQLEEDLLALDLDKPAPLSRRKAEKVVKGIIEPFRDPNTPIQDVLSAFAEFHPTRMQQLAETIVSESANTYPDEWLKSITGLDVTVDQIKEWAAAGGSSPANTAPTTAQSQPADSPEMKQLVEELDGLYGSTWRDPSKDNDLLDADKAVVLAVRSHLAKDEAYASLQKELAETKSQLGDIAPKVDTIAHTQSVELEQNMLSAYDSDVETYRQKVESNSIPKVLEAKGLVPKDSDTQELRAAKELLQAKFNPVEGYGSDFDIFLEKQFSGKESMAKAMNRVGTYLAEAAKLDATASRTGDIAQANGLKQKATAMREQAYMEQDALTVWTRKAATEFLESAHVKPLLLLLEQNIDFQRRINASGRPEIIGQTAAIGGEAGWKAKVQEAKRSGTNPFDLDISDILSGR